MAAIKDLRTPKGTVDYSPVLCKTLEIMISKIKRIFVTHNAVEIATPAFELRHILMNKYGEDSKLIYNLEGQGGDICSLRYDLTVPFSRYLSTNRISHLRRFQIGSVFRRDNPSFATGRLREFTQADFDICGSNLPMVNDSEALKIIFEILTALEKDFVIRINDRRILAGILQKAGVPEAMHGTVCSSIDKLDKNSWADVLKELEAKGVDAAARDVLERLLSFKGTNSEIMDFLQGIEDKSPEFAGAIAEFQSLFTYLEVLKVEKVAFDLSLARGLDYYTGIIIEATVVGAPVGSVIGGGRYDNLCKSISSHTVPCVGFSVGVTRLLAITEPATIRHDVFVGSAYGLLVVERMQILRELWDVRVSAETFSGKRVNFKDQMEQCKKGNFRYGVF
ncbi:histidyl-tRNA synthetase, partial [Enteropsectra breve]